MPDIVISDTSALIILQKIDELNLLNKIYGELLTTPEIINEFGEELPHWIKIVKVKDKRYQKILETQIDTGEASAIALASEYEDALLILDDLKARNLAKKLNFRITGTLGLIHKAKQLSIIENVKPLIEKLLLTDFRISDKIIEELLRINNE